MSGCLFCRIIAGEIPGAIVHQDERVVAFKDINAQAPLHVLVVPRRHIATLNELGPDDDGLVGEMIRRGARVRCARLSDGVQLQRGRGADRVPHPPARPRRAFARLASGLTPA